MATNLNAEDGDDEQNPQSSRSKAQEEAKNILTDPLNTNKSSAPRQRHSYDENENPLENPEVVQILEMYPDKSPEMILQIFNDCDGRKDVVIETLMTAENYIQGPP